MYFPSLFSVQGKINDYGPKNVGFTNNILENDKIRQNQREKSWNVLEIQSQMSWYMVKWTSDSFPPSLNCEIFFSISPPQGGRIGRNILSWKTKTQKHCDNYFQDFAKLCHSPICSIMKWGWAEVSFIISVRPTNHPPGEVRNYETNLTIWFTSWNTYKGGL